MSQKPSDSSREPAGDQPTDGPARDANETTAPQGLPVISRNIELAADAALTSMVVAYSQNAKTEHDRVTMPPPVPMEQLVEHMMLADSDRAPPPDIKPIIHTTPGDSNPPGSDVDTVRTKMADMQRVPMSPAPASGPQDDVPSPPQYPHDADTLPPSNIVDDTEPGYRPLMSEPPPPMSPKSAAIDTAEAVLGEMGLDLLRARAAAKDLAQEEGTSPSNVEEHVKNRPSEDRRRFTPNSRLTPPRTMRPISEVLPPTSSTGRISTHRRRPSETGLRTIDIPPPSERLGPPSTGSTSARVLEIRELYEAGDHRAALRIAETILQENPGHLAALGYAESSRQMLRQKYLARIGDMNAVPRIKHVAIELARVGLDGRDMSILDAIDGVLTVEEIVSATGVPTIDILRVLHDLIVDGLVEFVGTATGRR
jgi:hypothetical protein